jgi:hypothetical protein
MKKKARKYFNTRNEKIITADFTDTKLTMKEFYE